MPKNQFQRMVFAFLNVVVTVFAGNKFLSPWNTD